MCRLGVPAQIQLHIWQASATSCTTLSESARSGDLPVQEATGSLPCLKHAWDRTIVATMKSSMKECSYMPMCSRSTMQNSRERTHCGNRVALCSSGTAAMTSTSFGALAKQYLREACNHGKGFDFGCTELKVHTVKGTLPHVSHCSSLRPCLLSRRQQAHQQSLQWP